MLTVSSVVLLAQIAADPISGGAGWIGAGLLGAVLAWLMFVHLPGKDKLIRELQAESQAFVQRLMDRHDAAVRAQQEMLTTRTRRSPSWAGSWSGGPAPDPPHCRDPAGQATAPGTLPARQRRPPMRPAPAALALALVLAATGAAPADPPAVTPVPAPASAAWTELKVPAGEIVVLAAAPASEWDADPVPHVFDAGKHAVFLLKPGEARKVTVTGPDRARTRLVLVAGTPTPKPKPDPVPPKPADPLAAKLKAAFDADLEPVAERRSHAKDLAELYRQAADLAAKAEVASAADLLARVRAASGMLVGPDALKGVRREVAAELGMLLPTDAALNDEQRKAVAELFRKLAQILDGM